MSRGPGEGASHLPRAASAIAVALLLLSTLPGAVRAGDLDTGAVGKSNGDPAGIATAICAVTPASEQGWAPEFSWTGTARPLPASGDSLGSPYYEIPLVSTRAVSGTGNTTGQGLLVFPTQSPFGISVAPDGSYRYRVEVAVHRLPARARGVFVAWVTTPEIDRVRRVGPLDENGRVAGEVDWNRFLVVVTLEPADGVTALPVPDEASGPDSPVAALHVAEGVAGAPPPWVGPVILRGMSRSGRMHTMAGHGPYEQEECAQYGF